ncbi:MAG: flagellar hook-basal body complex protein [Lawsonibacter sp.]|jgi:flagellar basal-body rod protein FlgG|nr:flagellar hook-basal body complex protein [Lawsonibacter sp.]
MNMSFYTGAVGAYMQNQRMNVQANNIANVNNYGFKAERATFHHLMYSNVLGIDEEQLPKGSGTKMVKASTDFSCSGYTETGRRFDFAIEGDGFFALYNPADGEISFTRDGAFMMAQFLVPPPEDAEPEIDPVTGEEIEPQPTEEWRLSDNEGRCVLDSMGNFIVIDRDNRDAELDVGVYDYMIYDGMLHADSGRFLPIDKNGDLYLGTGKVRRGYLEVSNVDLAQELVKVIESQRAYSYALKMVQTSDEIEQTINGLPN